MLVPNTPCQVPLSAGRVWSAWSERSFLEENLQLEHTPRSDWCGPAEEERRERRDPSQVRWLRGEVGIRPQNQVWSEALIGGQQEKDSPPTEQQRPKGSHVLQSKRGPSLMPAERAPALTLYREVLEDPSCDATVTFTPSQTSAYGQQCADMRITPTT